MVLRSTTRFGLAASCLLLYCYHLRAIGCIVNLTGGKVTLP